MLDLTALKASNEKRWAAAKLTTKRASEFKAPAQKAVDNKARYQSIQARNTVNWVFIAVSHYRELNAKLQQEPCARRSMEQDFDPRSHGPGPVREFRGRRCRRAGEMRSSRRAKH